MTPDRRRSIFADKPRDPRPVIKPERPRFGCILFAIAFVTVAIFTLKPTVTDLFQHLDAPSSAPDAGRGDRAGKAIPGNPQAWVTEADYPSEALRAGMQGAVSFVLSIDAAGRVTDCAVTASSGWPLLDSTSCDLLLRRAIFKPARDESGAAIASTYSSKIRWTIPE